jgi:hypothetical protein
MICILFPAISAKIILTVLVAIHRPRFGEVAENATVRPELARLGGGVIIALAMAIYFKK